MTSGSRTGLHPPLPLFLPTERPARARHGFLKAKSRVSLFLSLAFEQLPLPSGRRRKKRRY